MSSAMAANDSASSADSYVAHVNDKPRLDSGTTYPTVDPIPNGLTQMSSPKYRLSDVLSPPHAYPAEAALPADRRVTAASPTGRRGSALAVGTPNRPPSVPRDRKGSFPSGDYARSNSGSNSKLYFHQPPLLAAQDRAALGSGQAARSPAHTPPARRDVKPLSNGAVCTPTSSEGADDRPVLPSTRKPFTPSKYQGAMVSPVKASAETPNQAARRDELKEQSISLPFTSNHAYGGGAVAERPSSNSAAVARRASPDSSGAARRSLNNSHTSSARASKQPLVARMSVSQSNAGAMVPYADQSAESCETAYRRSYDLTLKEHKPPSRRVSVQRYIPTARQSEWNSNRKETRTAPLEVLPAINLSTPSPHYARASSAQAARGHDGLANGDEVNGHEQRVHSLPVSTFQSPSTSSPGRGVTSGSGKDQLLLAHRFRGGNAIDMYRDELGDALDQIDFKRAMVQLNTGNVGGDDYQAALAFFSLIAKDQLTLFPEDLHELLVLFTPPGVALREAEDFMWEECENKTRLSFAEFLLYGQRLRDRVFDYEQFVELNDIQRLLVTYARVFPGRPSQDRDHARVRLLAAARDQLSNELADKFRPLRVYEHLFLVDYQDMLYRAGVVHATEVPPEVRGDLPSDVQAAARERRRHSAVAAANDTKSKEAIEWGPADAAKPAGTVQSREVTTATKKDRSSEYPSLARCHTKGNKETGGASSRSTTAGSRPSRKARNASARSARPPSQLGPGCVTRHARDGSAFRRSRCASGARSRQPFEVRTVRDGTLDTSSRNAKARYMGATPNTDRRTYERQDDSLIQRLQITYSNQA